MWSIFSWCATGYVSLGFYYQPDNWPLFLNIKIGRSSGMNHLLSQNSASVMYHKTRFFIF